MLHLNGLSYNLNVTCLAENRAGITKSTVLIKIKDELEISSSTGNIVNSGEEINLKCNADKALQWYFNGGEILEQDQSPEKPVFIKLLNISFVEEFATIYKRTMDPKKVLKIYLRVGPF